MQVDPNLPEQEVAGAAGGASARIARVHDKVGSVGHIGGTLGPEEEFGLCFVMCGVVERTESGAVDARIVSNVQAVSQITEGLGHPRLSIVKP